MDPARFARVCALCDSLIESGHPAGEDLDALLEEYLEVANGLAEDRDEDDLAENERGDDEAQWMGEAGGGEDLDLMNETPYDRWEGAQMVCNADPDLDAAWKLGLIVPHESGTLED